VGQRCDGVECRGAQNHAGIEAGQARIKRQLTVRLPPPRAARAPECTALRSTASAHPQNGHAKRLGLAYVGGVYRDHEALAVPSPLCAARPLGLRLQDAPRRKPLNVM
jgi:hypothetical protein